MSSRITRVSRKPKRGRLPSFVECIAIFGAIALVTIVVVPTLASHRQAGRVADAKHDTYRIGEAMLAMIADLGQQPYKITIINSFKQYPTVELFVSPGSTPATPRRDTDALAWVQGVKDNFNDQLIDNTSAYEVRYETNVWRGPYLSKSLSADPWGNAYVANIRLLSTRGGSRDAQGCIKSAVFILSAGANGVIETLFKQPITEAKLAGDDIAYRIQ